MCQIQSNRSHSNLRWAAASDRALEGYTWEVTRKALAVAVATYAHPQAILQKECLKSGQRHRLSPHGANPVQRRRPQVPSDAGATRSEQRCHLPPRRRRQFSFRPFRVKSLLTTKGLSEIPRPSNTRGSEAVALTERIWARGKRTRRTGAPWSPLERRKAGASTAPRALTACPVIGWSRSQT